MSAPSLLPSPAAHFWSGTENDNFCNSPLALVLFVVFAMVSMRGGHTVLPVQMFAHFICRTTGTAWRGTGGGRASVATSPPPPPIFSPGSYLVRDT